MHSLKKTLIAALCCVLVSGCSTLGLEEEGPRETVYEYNDPDIDMTYPEMAREMSDGRVQLFSLDDPAAPLAPPASYPTRYGDGGVPSSVDPNVTVYPFDDGSTQPLVSNQRPALMPPSAQARPLQAPFGGPLQAPAPQLMPPAAHTAMPYSPPAAASGTSRIYFKHGSSRLNDTGKQVVDFVGRSKTNKIVVEGHASERAETADPVERDIVNLKMSMDRAFKVSSELIRDGVPANMIETRAYGDAKPAGAVDGHNQEAASRRVEIKSKSGAVVLRQPPLQPAIRPVPFHAPPPAAPPAPIPPLAPY